MALSKYFVVKKLSFSFLFLFILSTSCTVVQHGMINPTSTHSKGNIHYLDEAITYSQVHYFMGLGGYRTYNMTIEAKHKLYANYTLEVGQTFENFSITQRKTYFTVFVRHELFLHADIVQRDTNFHVTLSDTYQKRIEHLRIDSLRYFKINEKVLWLNAEMNLKPVTIIDLNTQTPIVLLNESKKQKIRRIEENLLFTTEPIDTNYVVGNEIEYINKFGELAAGKLMGVNQNYAVIENRKSKLERVTLSLAAPNFTVK